jgi:hypothetical protein
MTYGEIKGSGRTVNTGKREVFIELGVRLTSDSDGPSAGDQPISLETTRGAITAIDDFSCTRIDSDIESLPGLILETSQYERFVAIA